MKYDITLTVGHNVNGVLCLNTDTVRKAVSDVLGVDALTAYPVQGVWCGDVEPSTRVELNALSREARKAILAAIPTLSETLNQECIMTTCTRSTTRFL